MKRKLKTLMLRGKRFKIKDVPACDGSCTDPSWHSRVISIPVDGDTLGELTVIIHEMLHGCFWDIDEDIIDQVGYDMARILWDLGWRNEND